MRARKRRREPEKAAPDLTPMIDVTFQLLIFFLLCTRFITKEECFKIELPREQGITNNPSMPREHLTLYCLWDEAAGANSYVVAMQSRGRKPVPDSYATLPQVVILDTDRGPQVRAKKEAYARAFNALVAAIEEYIADSGSTRIENVEVSFAVNATQGAASGTAPWVFVSLAVDSVAGVNELRAERGQPTLGVVFKFTDALDRYR